MRRRTGGTDQLLRVAIHERRVVTFTLDGLRQLAEPHDYGIIDGIAKLFFYQLGGEPSGLGGGEAAGERPFAAASPAQAMKPRLCTRTEARTSQES